MPSTVYECALARADFFDELAAVEVLRARVENRFRAETRAGFELMCENLLMIGAQRDRQQVHDAFGQFRAILRGTGRDRSSGRWS